MNIYDIDQQVKYQSHNFVAAAIVSPYGLYYLYEECGHRYGVVELYLEDDNSLVVIITWFGTGVSKKEILPAAENGRTDTTVARFINYVRDQFETRDDV